MQGGRSPKDGAVKGEVSAESRVSALPPKILLDEKPRFL